MALSPDKLIQAVAVLRPEGGAPKAAPSSRTIGEWRSPPDAAKRAATLMRRLGLDAEESGPGALNITGSVKAFQALFGVTLEESSRGGIHCSGGKTELPLAKLPEPLRDLILQIGFEQPPDFGPGGGFS